MLVPYVHYVVVVVLLCFLAVARIASLAVLVMMKSPFTCPEIFRSINFSGLDLKYFGFNKKG